MSRNANQYNLGYVPVPHQALDMMITEILKWKRPINVVTINPQYNFFDPCCGDGEALRYIISRATQGAALKPSDRFYGARVASFGMEVHQERAAAARKKLGRVLHGDFFMSAIEHNVMSFVWLNPPYDYDAEYGNTEYHFLEQTTPLLRRGSGILAYCVPRRKLKEAARHLAEEYENVKAMTFPDSLYEQYKQVILVATKRNYKDSNQIYVEKLMDSIVWFAEGHEPTGKVVMNDKPHDKWSPVKRDEFPTRITPVFDQRRIVSFRKREYDIAKAIEDTPKMFEHPILLERIKPAEDTRLESVTNIRNSHIVQLIASGALNNTVMPDGTIIKGSSTKIKEHEKEYTDDSVRHTETERSRTSIIELDTQSDPWKYTEYTNYTDVVREDEE